jgi:hypothetical protein
LPTPPPTIAPTTPPPTIVPTTPPPTIVPTPPPTIAPTTPPTIVPTTAQLRTHQHDPTVQPHCMSRTNTIKTTTARRSEHRHSLRTNTIKVAIACPPVDQRSSTASGIANHCTRLSHQPSHQYHQQHNTTIATCITPCNSLVAPNTIELVPPQSHPQQHVSNPITKCNHRLHVSHLLCISAVVMHGTAYTAWPCNLAMQRKPPRLTSQGMHCGAACAPRARQHVCARTCKRSGSICCKRRSQRERSSVPRARPFTRLVHGSQTHARQGKSDTTPHQSSVAHLPLQRRVSTGVTETALQPATPPPPNSPTTSDTTCPAGQSTLPLQTDMPYATWASARVATAIHTARAMAPTAKNLELGTWKSIHCSFSSIKVM